MRRTTAVLIGVGLPLALVVCLPSTARAQRNQVDNNPQHVIVDSGSVNVVCTSGCSGGTTDTDDGSIATGQSTGLSLGLSFVFDGSVWRRLTIGTAGTASAQVLTVQGISSMTPLLVNGSGFTQPVSGTFWQATQPVSLASVPSHEVTNAGTFAVQAAQSGTWNITNVSGTVSLPTGAATEATLSTLNGKVTAVNTGAVTISTFPDNEPVNVAQMNGVTVTMGNGASGTGVQRVTIASDSTGVVGLNTGSNLVGYVGRKNTYGSKTTITWTGTSLANGSARESTVIDNTSNRCGDVLVRVQTKGQSGGTNYLDLYTYTALGDTTYTDAATGSDAAFTAANRRNSRYLGSVKMNADTSAVQAMFALSDVWATMPDKWGLIGINNSGATLSATAGDHVLEYQCVN